MTDNRWWQGDELARRAPALAIRARLGDGVRDFFAGEGFQEVETPSLQRCPGMEPHLAAFETRLLAPGSYGDVAAAEGLPRYLHTSPEFAMKKLLAGGLERIWQRARVFRNGEGSSTHQPEFTLLEWYRAGAGLDAMRRDGEALLRGAATAAKVADFRHRGVRCDPFGDWQCLSVAEAFERYCGIDLDACIGGTHDDPPPGRLAEEARRHGIGCAEDDRFEDVFLRIMGLLIEPQLGTPVPTFLYDYPLALAALARPKPGESHLAERGEIYAAGLELANGFAELTDGCEQRRRFMRDMALKRRLYGSAWPVDEDFIAAVDRMPEAMGAALGFDRLAMLAAHRDDIRDVLWAWVE